MGEKLRASLRHLNDTCKENVNGKALLNAIVLYQKVWQSTPGVTWDYRSINFD